MHRSLSTVFPAWFHKKSKVNVLQVMAERIDILSCSVCLEVLREPVTLPCGHSFCRDCINDCWDREPPGGRYSCPQCRHTFTSRPELKKSTVLADLVGNMSSVESDHTVGPGDVECDFCSSTKKLKAVKSCLGCLASYCSTHLQPHYESAAFQKHQLVEVSTSLQERICSQHGKLMEVFCRTDGCCICLLCVMDEHKGHDTVSAAAERKDKQKQIGKKKQKFHHTIVEKEKQLHRLQYKMKEAKASADAVEKQNGKTFAEIAQTVARMQHAMGTLIRRQERSFVSHITVLVQRLQREVTDLKKREDELKQLSVSEDHIHFLLRFQAFVDLPETDAPVCESPSFDFVPEVASHLQQKLENLEQTIKEVSQTIQADPLLKTRQDFSLYSCQLSLDPNTAFENLLLSEGNSKVTWTKTDQKYPHHPDRFITYEQVLCCEELIGVHYWEVEWKGPKVEVAVCYRGGDQMVSCFGYSQNSWSLALSKLNCSFWHGGQQTKISGSSCPIVGVYLNQIEGSLAFYSLPNTGQMVLLHQVHTTFSQPLHAGFMVSKGASVKIRPPK